MADDSLYGYYVATVASIWFVTVISIAAELSPALKDSLAAIFLHHWLGKSILTLVVFGLVVVVAPTRRFDERRWANYAFGSVIVGSLLIFGYFVFHYFTA